jgi:flagellar hook-associated protein 3
MRISSNTIFEAGIRSIQQQQVDVLKTQQQLSTGRRILTPSDDPVAAARVLEVSQSSSLNDQYSTNRKTAISTLSLEESILGSITSLIQDVQTTAVNAGNPTLSNENRASFATELRGRYQELLGLANSNDGAGQYLFAGYQGATKPFAEASPGNVAYSGDQGQRLVQISASRQLAVSDAGLDIFQRIRNGNGTFVTAASASNAGTGIVDGGSVLDTAKWAAAANKDFTIRFAGDVSVAAGATNAATDAVTGGIVDQAAWDASSKSLQISVAAGAVAGTFDYTIADAALGSYTVNYDPATQNPLTVSLDGTGGTFNAGIDLVLSGTAPQALDTFTVAPTGTPGWSYDIVDNVWGGAWRGSVSAHVRQRQHYWFEKSGCRARVRLRRAACHQWRPRRWRYVYGEGEQRRKPVHHPRQFDQRAAKRWRSAADQQIECRDDQSGSRAEQCIDDPGIRGFPAQGAGYGAKRRRGSESAIPADAVDFARRGLCQSCQRTHAAAVIAPGRGAIVRENLEPLPVQLSVTNQGQAGPTYPNRLSTPSRPTRFSP